MSNTRRGPLTILRFERDGDGRLFGIVGYKVYQRVTYNLGLSCDWEFIAYEPQYVLDFAAGRAFGLRGEEIGENPRQAMIDGTCRILDAGRGWPRLANEPEPLGALESPNSDWTFLPELNEFKALEESDE